MLNVDLVARTNETFEFVRDFEFPGEEFPMSDAVFEMHVRRSKDAASLDLKFTSAGVGGGITVIDENPADEILTLEFLKTIQQIVTLSGVYYFDVRYTRAGRTTVIIQGSITFMNGLTRGTAIA